MLPRADGRSEHAVERWPPPALAAERLGKRPAPVARCVPPIIPRRPAPSSDFWWEFTPCRGGAQPGGLGDVRLRPGKSWGRRRPPGWPPARTAPASAVRSTPATAPARPLDVPSHRSAEELRRQHRDALAVVAVGALVVAGLALFGQRLRG